MPLTVSIVIPAVNEASCIEQSISRAIAAGADEIVVADGGSTDETLAILKEMETGGSPLFSGSEARSHVKIRVVQSVPSRGTQQNAGAAVATCDVLLFLHADSWLVENGCDQIRELLSDNEEILSGGFYQRIENTRWIYRWIERGNILRVKMRGLLYGDQGLFVRRKVFEELSGFPDVPLMEDSILSRALHQRGRHHLLAGPIFVNDRRWQRHGVLVQTLRNWFISTAFFFGSSPEWLAGMYRRHDE